jgi:phage shock protein PspC (stress-responsive transcriptional regulator)
LVDNRFGNLPDDATFESSNKDNHSKKIKQHKDMETQKLYRNISNKVIAGVCNGLSDYFKIDVTLIRIIFVLGTIFSHGPFGLLYLILWIVMPKKV